jgi:broad specificity phosphatase PhoE
MIIKLVRHGESHFNANIPGSRETPTHELYLTENGIEQAERAGKLLGSEFLLKSLIWRSPYDRCKQTLLHMLDGAGLFLNTYDRRGSSVGADKLRIYEDPRLREVEHGYDKTDDDMQNEEKNKVKHGRAYYRFEQGESPLDCFDRVSTFVESLHRQVARKKANRIVIVSHGLTIRCFIMRWFHLTIQQFESMRNPGNCDIVTIASRDQIAFPKFVSGKWAVKGIRLREPKEQSINLSESANVV